MFEHVAIRVSDPADSERFYDLVLGALGVERSGARYGDFVLQPAGSDEVAHNVHIGFAAPSRADVDAFWRAGTEAGYRDDGEPGPRPIYSPDYYGSFLLDPDGNSAEGVHHGNMRGGGVVDHVWIRVADFAASRRFYDDLAPRAGFELAAERDDYARYGGAGATFSIMPGERPTSGLVMAFPATGETGSARDPDGNGIELVKSGPSP
jgi:catechol 2,3-dioxygenase-like lactoylglutathione lyase family enzyme